MMNRIIKQYQGLSSPARRAFWMAFVLGIFMLVFTTTTIAELIAAKNIIEVISNSIPPVVGVFSIASAGLILQGKTKEGGFLLIGVFMIAMILIPVVTTGYGLTAAVIALFVPTMIANQLFTVQLSGRINILSFISSLSILLLNEFWPFQRVISEPENVVVANIMAGIMLVIFVAIIAWQFKHFPLQSKLVIGSLFLTVTPMAILGVMSTQMGQRSIEISANENMLASASQLSSSLNDFITYNLDTLRTEAQLNGIIEYLEIPVNERSGSVQEGHLRDLLNVLAKRDNVFISSYALLDIMGLSVMDTYSEDIGQLKADRGYYKEPISTGLPYVSPVHVSSTTNERSLYFSAPIRNSIGEVIGVLRVRYNADILQYKVVQHAAYRADQSFVMLLDDSKIILAHSANPDLLNKSIVPLDTSITALYKAKLLLPDSSPEELTYDLPDLAAGLANAETQPTFSGAFHADGAEHDDGESYAEQAAVTKMQVRPWYVVVAMPQETLYSPVKMLTRSTLLMGVVSSILAIFLSIGISQFISSPIVRLTGVANQVAAGELTARANVESEDEVGTLAKTFNLMAAQLNNLIGSLEQRVTDRTKALVASAEVSRRLSTILDQRRLVKEVVDQLQEAFNYYHVHIYLFDDSKEFLVMAAGTGEAGQEMQDMGHKIAQGKGLVGRAAQTGMAVLVRNVTSTPGWLPNPLLPETKSELAVPIAIGESVLGVLDVQHNQENGLQQEDADLLQSIANQIAIALQNARTYAQTQHRANREAMITAISQRIQRTSSPEEALQVAAREIGRALGSEYTLARLKTHPTNGDDQQS